MAFFYSILIDEGRFDILKDVYKGELMLIDDIPTTEGDDDGASQCRFLDGFFFIILAYANLFFIPYRCLL